MRNLSSNKMTRFFKSFLVLLMTMFIALLHVHGKPTEKVECGDFQCTREGFIEDVQDCTKFHRCVDWDGEGTSFTKYDFDCPEGTIWEAITTCNHPWAVSNDANCRICNRAYAGTNGIFLSSAPVKTQQSADMIEHRPDPSPV